jgi:excisionase family DNA binding protein
MWKLPFAWPYSCVMRSSDVKDVSVKEAASWLGVSERRVQALIEAERLSARRVGRSWLVPIAELPRVRYRSRPLSPRMARALLDSLSGVPATVSASERGRLRGRLHALLQEDDPASLLRSWLAAAAPPIRRFLVAPADLPDLSDDLRVVPGGSSDSRSGIAVVGEFEGWVAADNLEDLQREFLLIESSRPNVLLHVAPELPPRPLPLGWVLADLSAHGGTRESAAVWRLLAEQVTNQLPAAAEAEAVAKRAHERAKAARSQARKAEGAARARVDGAQGVDVT